MPNWKEVREELRDCPSPLDLVRGKYLRQLHEKTGRNVICYYSGFLQKRDVPQSQLMITEADKNDFMACLHQLDRDKGCDLLLHTHGGETAAAASLVDYLRQMFGANVRAIVPQIAMSAGTMIACSCQEIVMGKQSSIGPVDPQIGLFAARSHVKGFEETLARALNAAKEDPQTLPVWLSLLRNYTPQFIEYCQNAIKWSDDLVEEWLLGNMLSDCLDKEKAAEKIMGEIGSGNNTQIHARRIHAAKAREIGLKIIPMEKMADNDSDSDVLQDLILTIHHCYMHAFSQTDALKIVENHNSIDMPT